jgi:hypothetical protein
MMVVLEDVSPNLERLTVHWFTHPTRHNDDNPRDLESIDMRWPRTALFFPTLTHATFTYGAIRFQAFLPLLCQSAPNLVHLNVDLVKALATQWEHVGETYFPPHDSDTSIRDLRVNLQGYESDRYDDEDKVGRYTSHVCQLLRRCPELRKFWLDQGEWLDVRTAESAGGEVMRVVRSLSLLTDLYWKEAFIIFVERLSRDIRDHGERGFPSLRRLSVIGHDLDDIVRPLVLAFGPS